MAKRKCGRSARRRAHGEAQATGRTRKGLKAPPPDDAAACRIRFRTARCRCIDLFEQQTRQMLDRSDLDEEQKQNISIAMNCPCCGAGAMSYTVKLKR